MEIIIGILGAGIGGGIMAIVQLCLKRKWEKEDKKEAKSESIGAIVKRLDQMDTKLDAVSTDVGHVKIAEKAILSDRIKWLGTSYLEANEIEFEDRRNLHDLHDAYHNHCGGNGDYDILMREIDALPLKH